MSTPWTCFVCVTVLLVFLGSNHVVACLSVCLQYKGANIQLLDLPGIIEGAAQGEEHFPTPTHLVIVVSSKPVKKRSLWLCTPVGLCRERKRSTSDCCGENGGHGDHHAGRHEKRETKVIRFESASESVQSEAPESTSKFL